MRKINLPESVADRARAAGPEGERWLASLPELIAGLEEKWQVEIEEALEGGTHAFVAEALGRDGNRYAVKIDMPGDEGHGAFLSAVRALELAEGRGYVKLYAWDRERKACLLERLGRPLKDFGYPADRQIEILCRALQSSWVPVEEEGEGLASWREGIAWFRGFLRKSWEELGRPCREEVIRRAYEFLGVREAEARPEEFVLIHGDAHNTNLLEDPSNRGEFKLIDPDGVVYERAYDLGVILREWREDYRENPVAQGKEKCELLHRLTGVERRAIWQWGFLQSVSTGLLCLQIAGAFSQAGQELLSTAEAWLEVEA